MTTLLAALHGAKRSYGRRLALSVDSLQIYENDCVAIHGRNGSGKSTLLRILCGITQLSSGVFEQTPNWKKAAIAYCPQAGGLYGDLTLAENVSCMSRRVSSTSKHGLYEKLLKATSFDEAINTQVSKLSGGYQKLAMVAASLAIKAELLILDEPTSDLHPAFVEAIAEVLSQSSEHYLAVIFVDHSDVMINLAKRKIEIG